MIIAVTFLIMSVALFVVSMIAIENDFISGFIGVLCIPTFLVVSVVAYEDAKRTHQNKMKIEREAMKVRSSCMPFSEFQKQGFTIQTEFFGGIVNCISFAE